MSDEGFSLQGVVGGDDRDVQEVVLRMTKAAEDDDAMREVLADLAATRGGIFMTAFSNIDPERVQLNRREQEAVSS